MRTESRRRFRDRVMRSAMAFILLSSGGSFGAAGAEPVVTERIEWNTVPIEVTLKVGVERQINFPAPVKIGVPANVKAKLRVQSVSDTVYLTATTAFDPTRVVVQTREGEATYLLDVDASEKALSTPPIQIVDRASTSADDASADPKAPSSGLTDDPVLLTRFAAQQLYAPARLLSPTPGIVRVPVPTERISLVRGGVVIAAPLIGWRSDQRYVTAVKLTNPSASPIVLDPRELKGHWLTATFQHNRLLSKESEAESTVVYLVSAVPFAAARE